MVLSISVGVGRAVAIAVASEFFAVSLQSRLTRGSHDEKPVVRRKKAQEACFYDTTLSQCGLTEPIRVRCKCPKCLMVCWHAKLRLEKDYSSLPNL